MADRSSRLKAQGFFAAKTQRAQRGLSGTGDRPILEISESQRQKRIQPFSFALWLVAWFAGVSLARAELTAVALRCEYLVDPIGLDERQPRLSWRLESSERGQRQTAFRILAASTPELLAQNRGDLWDTGRIASGESLHHTYRGRPLASRAEVNWKVCVWDASGTSTWSATARWSMGFLDPKDWQARFISFRDPSPVHRDPATLHLPAARQYRKEFATPPTKSVRRATLHATALGIYELHLNGQRVGDALFMPGWTDYRERAYTQSYDVRGLLRPGANALGAWVADGWYAGYLGVGLLVGQGTERTGRATYGKTPALLAQLEIEYEDGIREIVGTDRSWKVSGDGPIREADILMGELYDARQEQNGWAEPGFDDARWESAIWAEDNGPVEATYYDYRTVSLPGQTPKPALGPHPVQLGFQPPRRLEAFPGVPIRPIQEIRPVAVHSPERGVHIFDLGQNISGVARLKFKGPAGVLIQLRYGEMLHPDGRLMTENLRRARAADRYILRGASESETYTPRFTYHGFRYVEVGGLVDPLPLETVTGIVLHSDTPLASGFECSDPLVNRLHQNIVWTQRANFFDLPTDCPQRDERLGWTGDAQIYAACSTYHADVSAFFSKWLRELMSAQLPSGAFPAFAPAPLQLNHEFGPGWTDAGVIVPAAMWSAYGDRRLLERCWPHLVRFQRWRRSVSRGDLGVVHGNDWGDWLAPGQPTPLDFIDTIYLARTSQLMAELSSALGRKREAATYRKQFGRTRAAFIRKYVQVDGKLRVATQSAYAMALAADLVPPKLRAACGAELARMIETQASATNSGLGTGFLGTQPLLPALTSVDRFSLALELLQSRQLPSWGFEIENGATTIWERWNSYTKEAGFGGAQNAGMNSFSHYAFGAVGEWMMRELAGLGSDGPGFERIVIRVPPKLAPSERNPRPIDWVRAHHDSIRGRIATHWRHEAGGGSLAVTIPASTTATVYLPGKPNSVTEGGEPLARRGLKARRTSEPGKVAVEIASGTYSFAWRE